MYIAAVRLFTCVGVTDHNNSQASKPGLNQQDNKHTVQLISTFSILVKLTCYRTL